MQRAAPQGGPGPNIKANVHHQGMVESSTRTMKKKEDVVPLPSCTPAEDETSDPLGGALDSASNWFSDHLW